MRQEFPKNVRLAAWKRADGNCEECKTPFLGRRPEYHHIKEDTFGGEPTLENCLCICNACHSKITRKRAAVIAKSNRIRNKYAGITKVKRKIPSRKFGT
jgi:5-methylcytosine-specific restriction endonuclease McrA